MFCRKFVNYSRSRPLVLTNRTSAGQCSRVCVSLLLIININIYSKYAVLSCVALSQVGFRRVFGIIPFIPLENIADLFSKTDTLLIVVVRKKNFLICFAASKAGRNAITLYLSISLYELERLWNSYYHLENWEISSLKE